MPRPNNTLTNEILIPLTGFCVFLSLFLWQPGTNEVLWLRRTFLYVAGFIALAALVIARKHIRLAKYFALAFFLLIAISTISLLISRPLTWGLIGQPIAHPGLFSLYSSIVVGVLFAIVAPKKKLFVATYLAITAFTVLNIIYWLSHGLDLRLGFLGVQLNYTAYLMLIGLITGVWAYIQDILPAYLIFAGQSLLLIGVLLTQSRLAILLALIIASFFIYTLHKANKKTVSIFALSILILLLGVASLSSHFNRLHNQHYFDTSVTYRLDIIKAAFPTKPTQLILGGGVGSLERNIDTNGHRYGPINKDLKDGWKFESSHNYLVDVLVERGVITLLLYAFLIAYAIRLGLHTPNKEQKLLFYMLVATLIFWLFNNINIQAELVMWCCIIGLLADYKHKQLSTSKLKTT